MEIGSEIVFLDEMCGGNHVLALARVVARQRGLPGFQLQIDVDKVSVKVKRCAYVATR